MDYGRLAQIELTSSRLLSRHEEYLMRNRHLWDQARLSPGDSQTRLAESLLRWGQIQEATEALFGTDRSGPIQTIDRDAYNIFLAFWAGEHRLVFEKVIEHSEWSFSRSEQEGDLSVEIYPSEWFIIKEPAASDVRILILRRL